MNSAVLSACGAYRYRLGRGGSGPGVSALIGVNPSTANAEEDDQTVRKMNGFWYNYQLGRLIVGNLFALRATDVKELATAPDPIGPENDGHLWDIIASADRVVCAWGPLAKQPAKLRGRWTIIRDFAAALDKPLLSLGAPCNDGHPGHPLMRPYSDAPRPWTPPV